MDPHRPGSMMVHRRGDVVWARVTYPRKWWPGLIHRTHVLGVTVSFFNLHKPLHLLESEVCSFDGNFGLLAKRVQCSTGMALLDRALDLLGRRAVWTLTCPCLYPVPVTVKDREGKRVGSLFNGNEVLGFVTGLAVSAIVDDSEFVLAVTVVNQLRVFRRFLVAQQMVLGSGDSSKLSSCLPFNTISESVGQQLETAVQQVEDLQEDQPKTGSLTQTDLTEHQSVREMISNLRSLALDSFFVEGEHLNIMKMHVLKFRQLSCENASQKFHKFSQDSTKSQIYDPTKNQPRVQFHGKGCQDSVAPHVTYSGNRLKRQQYQPTDFCFPPKLRKTMPLFSTNKVYACLQESKSRCRIPLLSGSHFEVYIQNQHSMRALWLETIAGNNLKQLVTDRYIFGLVNCISLGCNTLHPGIFKEEEENFDVLNKNRTITCLVRMQGSSVHQDSGTTDVRDDSKLMLLQHSATEKVLNWGLKAHSDEIFNSSAATNNCLLSHLTPDQLLREHTEKDDTSHSEPSKGMSMNSSCIDSFMDCKEHRHLHQKKKEHQQSGIDQSFKPPAPRLPVDAFAKCKTLHMKFPQGFIIPSKNDLIRRFSRFGTVDSLRTKIFSRMSAAQVVFLHELDAAVAYRYVRRKKNILGESKILFWLDRYEHKRGGSGYSTSAGIPGGCNLRSCLKKSSHHRKEDRKCKKRVRFIMET